MVRQYRQQRKVGQVMTDERAEEIRAEHRAWYRRTLERVAAGDGPSKWQAQMILAGQVRMEDSNG